MAGYPRTATVDKFTNLNFRGSLYLLSFIFGVLGFCQSEDGKMKALQKDRGKSVKGRS